MRSTTRSVRWAYATPSLAAMYLVVFQPIQLSHSSHSSLGICICQPCDQSSDPAIFIYADLRSNPHPNLDRRMRSRRRLRETRRRSGPRLPTTTFLPGMRSHLCTGGTPRGVTAKRAGVSRNTASASRFLFTMPPIPDAPIHLPSLLVVGMHLSKPFVLRPSAHKAPILV